VQQKRGDGRIRLERSGKTYFDLANSTIGGKIAFEDGSYGYDNTADKPDLSLYDNTKTVIDGGIVTSGAVQLAGSDSSIKAGITGEETADSSVRVWAGDTKENRAAAPFRVTQDGSLVASKAIIEGKFKSSSRGRRVEIDPVSGNIIMYTTGLGTVGNVEYEAYKVELYGEMVKL
jgi:hypothetical protein